jgi:hypothetical protein
MGRILSFVLLGLLPVVSAAAEKPNVIVILADDKE